MKLFTPMVDGFTKRPSIVAGAPWTSHLEYNDGIHPYPAARDAHMVLGLQLVHLSDS